MWIYIPFRRLKASWDRLVEEGEKRYEPELLIRQRDYGQEQFDKLIVYLSSGALALSVGFVKDLVGETPPEETQYLKFAWTAFAFALCLNLVSHKTSVLDADCEIKLRNRLSNFWGRVTEIFNWLSLISFMVGVLCFVIFAYPKLRINDHIKETDRGSKGRSYQAPGVRQADSGGNSQAPTSIHSQGQQ